MQTGTLFWDRQDRLVGAVRGAAAIPEGHYELAADTCRESGFAVPVPRRLVPGGQLPDNRYEISIERELQKLRAPIHQVAPAPGSK